MVFYCKKIKRFQRRRIFGRDRASRGFDFLDYHVSPHGLTVAKDTFRRFVEFAARLYEQERKKPYGFPRLGQYVKRWFAWLMAGDIFLSATLIYRVNFLDVSRLSMLATLDLSPEIPLCF